MFTNQMQTAKQDKTLLKKKRQFNMRMNTMLNNTHHNTLPTMSEVSVVKEVSNGFENDRSNTLNEFRRFMNVAAQIAQGTKSIRQANKIKN